LVLNWPGCSRDREKIRVLPPAQEYDLARYVPPARRLLDPKLYAGLNSYVPYMGIETKRGCPYSCAYCVYPKLQGGRLRCRPPADVVDEMEALQKEFGVESFHFTDPVLNIPHGHLEDICREILRRRLKVRWSGFIREDHFNEQNAALFDLLYPVYYNPRPFDTLRYRLETWHLQRNVFMWNEVR
jgi:radical SAM superfamily enzyme YgiQ (UPF0313 family)